MPDRTVCVSIVTHNSNAYIARCLDAVLAQEGIHLEIVVVDNASTDGTCETVGRRIGCPVRLIRNRRNLGFAAAQNQAIAASRTPWVLALNPDVLLEPGFLAALLDAAEADPHAGSICGKLLAIGPGFVPLPEPKFDSTGIYFTPAMRHFDRGWHELDDGRYDRCEYVFGVTGAAALYRREMIDDISIGGEFFDPAFFCYREDADVAWRAQLLGWHAIYTPHAVGYHVRTVSPENRRAVSPMINMHSVKNRFLLRIKNLTPDVWRRCWAAMTWRDLMVIGGCLFTEPRSLAAVWRLARLLPRARAHRRWIMSRRRNSEDALAAWFSYEPATSTPVQLPATGYVLKRSSMAT